MNDSITTSAILTDIVTYKIENNQLEREYSFMSLTRSVKNMVFLLSCKGNKSYNWLLKKIIIVFRYFDRLKMS